jgi:hypothetical protein
MKIHYSFLAALMLLVPACASKKTKRREMPRKSMDFVEDKEMYAPTKEVGMSRSGKELGFDEPMEYEVDYQVDPAKESLMVEDIEIEDAGINDDVMYEIDAQSEEISIEE